ncbi:5-methyltetrahydropteroyltriglutamate--homocysteine S-methyltransferase [Pseudalkalibacillus sp. JSM 102089]|uniref:5-methyltetrahydropteroyltriglutamate-- homocysteine S-methyltransferase n=1 Tax=Pseudalkalibacillus sp. JSM 102089 TaxID=3229856 RepID=UPI00352557C6
MTFKSSNIGYPRIGEKREWKKLLEKFWAGKLDEDTFTEESKQLRLSYLKKQRDKGIDLIPVGDFSLYDHVLDTGVMFGIVPTRFDYDGGGVSLQTYFNIARGTKGAPAAEMTKWYNTNYHYIVPELNESTPSLVHNRPLEYYREAKQELGIEGKPVLIGPISFVLLSKGYAKEQFNDVVYQFLPLYEQVLNELGEEGVQWVQFDEPALVTTLSDDVVNLYKEVYEALHNAAPEVNVLLQTYFESVTHYEEVTKLPVQGIGLDFVHDRSENLKAVKEKGFPQDKVLVAGLIDGRNVWRSKLDKKISLLNELAQAVDKGRIIVQPSSSLLHVPVTVKSEKDIPDVLFNALSFADEKLDEVVLLAQGLEKGESAIQLEIKSSVKAIQELNHSPQRNNKQVQETIHNLGEAKRKAPFKVRHDLQQKSLQIPFLPTTTIGSFPQTKEVRKQRLQWRKGELSDAAYETYIKEEIKKWIDIQEEIGLDVLVHGEFERTDMVEYFGEKLNGFQFTKFGWVQSYGSRCVKPPLIFGDVSFNTPMTVKETIYAQSLTDKHVKGMLTGPITIVNWSFVRDDRTKTEVANQIALALREEIEELERNAILVIQVDEPALREGLPLKEELHDSYLKAAVYAFKLVTSSVENETQIHTHMCYSEFEEIIGSIKALDADVISIETSRSHGELIKAFEDSTYERGIGLGVYDIHSPRVPELSEMKRSIDRALQVLDPKLFWINPDCGLKTRGVEETVEALKVMVEAAKQTRGKYLAQKN